MLLKLLYTFPTFCLPASLFFEKLQPLYIEMAPKRTPQALQRPSAFLTFCIIILPGDPQGAPVEPPRTTRDHPGTARELPRNPPGPQGPQESPSFFPPSFLLPPSSLFLPPFLLPPPSFLPSLCKFWPTTSGQPVCAPTLGIPTGGRRHRAPALKIRRPKVVL